MNDPYDVDMLERLVEQTQLKTRGIEYRYEGKFHHLAASFLFTALAAVIKPAAELLLLLNYGLLKGVSFGLKMLHAALGQSRKALR